MTMCPRSQLSIPRRCLAHSPYLTRGINSYQRSSKRMLKACLLIVFAIAKVARCRVSKDSEATSVDSHASASRATDECSLSRPTLERDRVRHLREYGYRSDQVDVEKEIRESGKHRKRVSRRAKEKIEHAKQFVNGKKDLLEECRKIIESGEGCPRPSYETHTEQPRHETAVTTSDQSSRANATQKTPSHSRRMSKPSGSRRGCSRRQPPKACSKRPSRTCSQTSDVPASARVVRKHESQQIIRFCQNKPSKSTSKPKKKKATKQRFRGKGRSENRKTKQQKDENPIQYDSVTVENHQVVPPDPATMSEVVTGAEKNSSTNNSVSVEESQGGSTDGQNLSSQKVATTASETSESTPVAQEVINSMSAQKRARRLNRRKTLYEVIAKAKAHVQHLHKPGTEPRKLYDDQAIKKMMREHDRQIMVIDRELARRMKEIDDRRIGKMDGV